jgi:hypothetical protein
MQPTPPKKALQEFHLPSSMLEDPTQEPLTIILTPYQGITHVPSELGTNDTASLVFIELNKCFKRAGFVAEGMLANLIWGFEECGYSANNVASGLSKLRRLGYVRYSDARGNPISDIAFDPKKPIWIRYDKKFTELFVRSLIAS